MAQRELQAPTISSSLRRTSYSAPLLRALPSLAPAHMTFTPAPSFDAIPFYSQSIFYLM